MGAKSEQLLVLKEEEKLLLTFRSRVNDQLNRLKVEELSILSLMRKAQEEAYAGDEINLDDESDEERNDVPLPRDISHLTSMTGGFRAQNQGAGDDLKITNAVFRADPSDDRMTTMEVDLGDFESGSGFGGVGLSGAVFGALDFMTGSSDRDNVNPTIRESAEARLDLVPLDLGFGKTPKVEEMEEEEEDDD